MKTIASVDTKQKLKAFIDFPHQPHQDDPNYVPEPDTAQRDLLAPGKHPFHKHSSLQLFPSLEEGEVAGCIATTFNNDYNAFKNTREGFFYLFDCIDDMEVKEMLFQEEACKWLSARGVTSIISSVNFSTKESCGLLIEGSESPAMA